MNNPTVEGWEGYYPEGTSFYDQMRKIEAEGKCPFCPGGNLPNKIVAETADWIAVERWPEPYKNAVLHWLLIPTRMHNGGHLTRFEELVPGDLLQVQILIGMAQKFFPGVPLEFGLGYREGKGTGRTMAHFHIHLIVPTVDSETGKPPEGKYVNFPIG